MKKLLICYIALSIVKLCIAMDKKRDLNLKLERYYQRIDDAEKRKDLKQYINLIRQILPADISSQITEKWIGTLIRTEAIRNKYTSHRFITAQKSDNVHKPKLIMSSQGDYFIHNIKQHIDTCEITLCNTKNNKLEYQFESQYKVPAYFSPQNNYIITREWSGMYVYHILTQQKHLLLHQKEPSYDIIISSNSKYILHEGRHPIMESTPFYKLWELDQFHKPQEITLKKNLIGVYSVLFHPNNEQIYCSIGNLHLYDIVTQQDNALPSRKQEDPHQVYLVHNLISAPDKTHMLCNVWIENSETFITRYVLLNIQNPENVIITKIPVASLYPHTRLTPLCTAYTHLIPHVCNQGKSLQLLDENMELVASHDAQENSYISALAIDHIGNYLASGYSDGTIILWDISNPQRAIHGKKLIGSQGSIKKLTFTDNHLLLSQSVNDSTPGTAILWDTQGNEIINFGNSVLKSTISNNGKKVAIISKDIHRQKKYLTVKCYNLDVPMDLYTLKQGYKLFKKYNSKAHSAS